MNDLVTHLTPPHVLSENPELNPGLSLDWWIRGSLSWFVHTQVDFPADSYLPELWAQQLATHLQCSRATMAEHLHRLTLEQLDLPVGLQRLATQGTLDKPQLFVLGLCAVLNDYYEVNIALQALQGAQQQPWPRLYLLCDLVQAICGDSISPTGLAQWHWLHSGVLQLHAQGPLALAWVELNNHYWQWLQRMPVSAVVRNEFFSAINYSINDSILDTNNHSIANSIKKPAITSGTQKSSSGPLENPQLNMPQMQACSAFAIAMRLGQLQQLHLCGSRSAILAWVENLADCLNKTPILPSAECELPWLNLLCVAQELLPVIEASGELNKPGYGTFNGKCYSAPMVVWHPAPLGVDELVQLQQTGTKHIHYLPGSARDERFAAWQRWVTPAQADEFARRWLIAPDVISSLAASIPLSGRQKNTAELRAAIAQARHQLAPGHLQNLAFLVPNQIAVDALVLNPKIHAELAALQIRCEQREQVFCELGPAVAGAGHGGVKALLYGESGTGKTLAALYLASQLAVPVYRLDLGAVLNKYIGETEKNIHQLMLDAAAGDFILLIDEADALFAKRGDGDSGGERFANMLTNYLLARIEQHPGIVLMTTNGLGRIDGAFMRRFDRVIEFHSPTLDERARLWQNHLGARSPGEQACLHLASLCDLSGGFIRNAVLAAAAELPVNEQPQLSFSCLLQSVVREYRKSGKPLPPKLLNQLNLGQPDKVVQA